MISHLHLHPIGRMAVFLVPARKLAEHPDIQAALETTLLRTYEGYTKMTQHIEGHYRMGPEIVRDDHVRYEVSFSGKDRIESFVQMLVDLATDLGEDSLYLTMGDKSYLVGRHV